MALVSYGAMGFLAHSPLQGLIFATAVGGLTYLAALFLFDIANLRGIALRGIAAARLLPILAVNTKRSKQ